MKLAFLSWIRSRSRILGINRRNLDYVFAGYRPGKFRNLDDKILAKTALERDGVPVSETFDILDSARDLHRLRRLLDEKDELVIKPARGSGGRGILVLSRKDGNWVRPGGEVIPVPEIETRVQEILSGDYSLDEREDRVLIEDRIHPHPFMLELYPDGVADLRIVLNQGKPVQAMCRVPTGESGGKANLHEGGVGMGLDLETGQSTSAVHHGRSVDRHPDTGRELVGVATPHWDRCLEMAIAASRCVDVHYLGVDIILDRDRGPLVIEINARPGLGIQIANRAFQPVPDPNRSGWLERLTAFAGWGILVSLVAAPLLAWQAAPPTVAPTRIVASGESGRMPGMRDGGWGTEEWDDAEIPLSSVSERFRSAREAMAVGDTLGAMGLYEDAVSDSALAPFALNNLAVIHRRLGQLEESETLLQRALALHPDYARALYNLALIHTDRGRPEVALEALDRSLALRPGSAKAWGEAGAVRLDLGDLEGAIRDLEQAIRFDPSSKAYRYRLGRALRTAGRFADAVPVYADLRALDLENEASVYGWARSVLDAPGSPVSPDSVLRVLKPFLSGKGSSSRCFGLAVRAWWREGDNPAAMLACERLVRRRYRPSTHRRGAVALAVRAGLWDRALSHLDRLPESPWAKFMLELCRLGIVREEFDKAGEFDLAEDPFRDPRLEILRLKALGRSGQAMSALTAVEDPGERALLAYLLGAGSAHLESHLSALVSEPQPDFEQLIDTADIPPVFWLWRVHQQAVLRHDLDLASRADSILTVTAPVYAPRLEKQLAEALATGDPAASLRIARKLLSIDRGSPQRRLILAEVYLDSGDLRAARRQLDRLDEGEKKSLQARFLEARALLMEGRSREARRRLLKLQQESSDRPEILVLLADATFRDSQYAQASVAYREALRLAPEDVEVRRKLAKSWMMARMYKRAIEEWARIRQLDPGNTSDLFQHALAAQRAEHLEQAVGLWDELLVMDPARYRARYNRALALEDLGRLDEAREGFESVLKTNPDHEGSRRHLAVLARGNPG